jgi:hypothetical protein
MIITDKFVFLHYPKTGGSFVTHVLKKIHRRIRYRRLFINAPACRELLLPNIKRVHGAYRYNQHGIYIQIPEAHRTKPVISCIRNPFDRYVSTYEFRNWSRKYPAPVQKIIERYPDFPDINFEQYLSFINTFDIESRVYHDLLHADIGMITYSFIQFFFKNPEMIIRNLNDEYLMSDAYKNDMPEITFLRTETLNRDLHDLLLKFDYREDDISFILQEEKVNVSKARKTGKSWAEYYTDDLIEYVRQKERFFLRMFPEYAVDRNLERKRIVQ